MLEPAPTLSLITPPASEPLTLAEAKAHLRVVNGSEDDLISAYLAAARQTVESITGRAFLTQTRLVTLADWPCDPRKRFGQVVQLDGFPLATITHVKYYADGSDTLSTLSTDNYIAQPYAKPGNILFLDTADLPSLASRPDAVQITYDCGYATATLAAQQIPGALIALRQLVTHLYTQRAPVNVGNITSEIPFSMRSLIELHRVDGWCG